MDYKTITIIFLLFFTISSGGCATIGNIKQENNATTDSDYQSKFDDVIGSLTFDNSTNTYITTFTTKSGLQRKVCMIVTEETPGVSQEVYNHCITSANGTMSYTIPKNDTKYHAIASTFVN